MDGRKKIKSDSRRPKIIKTDNGRQGWGNWVVKKNKIEEAGIKLKSVMVQSVMKAKE